MHDHSAPRVLLLEDDASDAFLIEDALTRRLPQVRLTRAATRAQYLAMLAEIRPDLVISDGSLPDCEGIEAFHLARERDPGVAFILVSGGGRHPDLRELRGLGISDFVSKDRLDDLAPALQQALTRQDGLDPARLPAASAVLGVAWAELAAAPDPETVHRLALAFARRLARADGAAFVTPAGEFCDWTAVDPVLEQLPVGLRLRAADDVAGWAVRNRRPALVDDVNDDPRLKPEPYQTASVGALVAVPVRSARPVGALVAWWAGRHEPDTTDVRLLQSLADAAASALAGLARQEELRTVARERGAELEGLTYAVSHDLRAPIRHLEGFTRILLGDLNATEDDGVDTRAAVRHSAGRIRDAAVHLREMVNGLLTLSRMSRAEMRRQPVDLAEVARNVALRLDHEAAAGRAGPVRFVVPDQLPVSADPTLLQVAARALLENAWKFSAPVAEPVVELGVQDGWGDEQILTDDERSPGPVYFVRDNGVGFDPSGAERLFGAFQRLHGEEEFPGIGIGLVTAARVIAKHGGTIRATGHPDQGATFFFTLG